MADHLLQPRLQPITGGSSGFFKESDVHIRSFVEGMLASHRPKQKDSLSRYELAQGFPQSLANREPEFLAALHPPLFSLFQKIHRAPIIRRGA